MLWGPRLGVPTLRRGQARKEAERGVGEGSTPRLSDIHTESVTQSLNKHS